MIENATPKDEQQLSIREQQNEPNDASLPGTDIKLANKVYVGNLPDDTREADLQDCFKEFGVIKSIELKTGYGFVAFDSRQAAEEAAKTYNGGSFLGNTIRVAPAHGTNKTGSKSLVEPGACFKCGNHGHWARECPHHQGVIPPRDWHDRGRDSGYGDRRESDRYQRGSSMHDTRDYNRVATTPRLEDGYGPGRDSGQRGFRRYSSAQDTGTIRDYPSQYDYDDRRPSGTQGSYVAPRQHVEPPSRGVLYQDRGYERTYGDSPSYDSRAYSYPNQPSRTGVSSRYDPQPPELFPSSQSYSHYPPTKDQAFERSPVRRGRVGDYNDGGRPYNRRRSASPSAVYREPTGSRSSQNVGYQRPSGYTPGPGRFPPDYSTVDERSRAPVPPADRYRDRPYRPYT